MNPKTIHEEIERLKRLFPKAMKEAYPPGSTITIRPGHYKEGTHIVKHITRTGTICTTTDVLVKFRDLV